MAGRIITVRHGKPALSRETYITATEFGAWWAQYDASGLYDDERPPKSLLAIAKEAKTVYSSTLPRAIETANHITGTPDRVIHDALFVEANLPPPPLPLIKLRPGPWGVVSRIFWFVGYAPGAYEGHGAAWKRVEKITDKLIAASLEGDVLLCAHGYLNWMIDWHLRKKYNWTRASRDRRNNHWSWRAYESPTEK